MTTLNQTLINFATLVGKDIKVFKDLLGDTNNLSTQAKTLVLAINELHQSIQQSGGATQTDISTAITQLKNELLGGDVSDQLDTLKELGDKLTSLESDESIKAAILNKFTEITQKITALETTIEAFNTTNLVEIYNNAKNGA